MKKLKKKLLILKVKICFLVVLPAVIILLAVRTLETFLRIRLRRTACEGHLALMDGYTGNIYLDPDAEHMEQLRELYQANGRPKGYALA